MNPLTTPLFLKDLLEDDEELACVLFGATLHATEESKPKLVNIDEELILDSIGEAGNRYLAEWLVESGELGIKWNHVLEVACEYGDADIALWSVEKGANDWNWALYWACRENHPEIADWLVEKGATGCVACSGSKHEFPPRE